MDRKRKLQAEELGTPPPKLKWPSQGFALEYIFPADAESDVIDKGELSGKSTAEESEQESGKDSNSVIADADSSISVSNEAEVGAGHGYFKEYSSDKPVNSSVDWGGDCSKHASNSSESSFITESSSGILESPSIGNKHDFPHHDIGLKSSLNYEEHLLEFGSHGDCSCPECRAGFEEYTDKELEEMLYSNGVNPNNYVLSSGSWTLNQDTQQSTKKLTIDKEFEQYFSMLML
ncbi:unnamed protein product [Coffea canephora]|uniref:Uncharacterized protein n=2 Tax=Coffea TaxID=13442 RepID=A0A068UTE3_COFCA|nr:protein FAR-RED ELONGATED HYPOCOTYL 1-like [Coffea arabica]XP_027094828.1 protein FAR-RED ELONGATED HYPOCOTYL 1-like [Coffea arabica]CDP10898.1 unnamed protein product [Coffea canephora]